MIVLLLFVLVAHSIDNGLGRTPPLGWRSWNLFGHNVNQELIMKQMDAIVNVKREVNGEMKSLADLGYSNVGLDDNWQKCGSYGDDKSTYHESDGSPVVNTDLFPNMKTMTDHAHTLGITAGWYGNNCICSDHVTEDKYYQGDVDALVRFEFDAVKLDGCGKQLDLDLWAQKLNATGRPVLIENCHWGGTVPNETWCPWNYFRTSGDVRANYASVIGNLQTVTQWLEKNLTKPGCWAYPDMLEVGCSDGPGGSRDAGLTMAETRSHFGSWAIVSSPLILSHDMSNDTITDKIWPIIANTEVLSVNQAWAGSAGGIFKTSKEKIMLIDSHFPQQNIHELKRQYTNQQIPEYLQYTGVVETSTFTYYYKPMPDGTRAVLLMNHQDEQVELTLEVNSIPGFQDKTVGSFRDIWNHKDVSTGTSVTCQVGAHDCCFYIVRA